MRATGKGACRGRAWLVVEADLSEEQCATVWLEADLSEQEEPLLKSLSKPQPNHCFPREEERKLPLLLLDGYQHLHHRHDRILS